MRERYVKGRKQRGRAITKQSNEKKPEVKTDRKIGNSKRGKKKSRRRQGLFVHMPTGNYIGHLYIKTLVLLLIMC